jgi:hypothetical protein
MREGFEVIQVKNGQTIAEFKNVKEAAADTKLYQSHIYACIQGRRKTTGGFSFQRKDTTITDEIWLEHPIGIKVSNHGRVVTHQNRKTFGFKCKRYLSMKWNQKNHYIHRLVLETFVGPPPDGYECDHIDRNPKNNRLENLRWVTHYDNMQNK